MGGGGIDKRPRSHNPFSPRKMLEQSGFVQRAASTALTSALDERSLYSLEVLYYQYSSPFFASGGFTVNSCVLYCQVAHACLRYVLQPLTFSVVRSPANACLEKRCFAVTVVI